MSFVIANTPGKCTRTIQYSLKDALVRVRKKLNSGFACHATFWSTANHVVHLEVFDRIALILLSIKIQAVSMKLSMLLKSFKKILHISYVVKRASIMGM